MKIPSKDRPATVRNAKLFREEDTRYVFQVEFCFRMALSKLHEDKRHIALLRLMYTCNAPVALSKGYFWVGRIR